MNWPIPLTTFIADLAACHTWDSVGLPGRTPGNIRGLPNAVRINRMLDMTHSEALEAARGLRPTASNLVRIGGLAGWAFGQWELRAKGSGKFSRAMEMLFVREALEQASHEEIAKYHASLFEPGELVVDLTSGIGGDTIMLAGRGPTIGVELDPERASYAAHNVRVYGHEAAISVGDALEFNQRASGVFADPSRRAGGRRMLSLDAFAPNPEALAVRCGEARRALMKLSPMLPDSELARFGAGIRFVEFGGECREALLVFGIKPGVQAVQVDTGETLEPMALAGIMNEPMAYLMEASPAAVRAHCLGQFGLSGLADSNGYLTAEKPMSGPWIRAYEVLWHGKLDQVGKELKRLKSSTPEIKQRGTGLDLIKLQKQWRSTGDRHCIVALYRVGKSLRALIMQIL